MLSTHDSLILMVTTSLISYRTTGLHAIPQPPLFLSKQWILALATELLLLHLRILTTMEKQISYPQVVARTSLYFITGHAAQFPSLQSEPTTLIQSVTPSQLPRLARVVRPLLLISITMGTLSLQQPVEQPIT